MYTYTVYTYIHTYILYIIGDNIELHSEWFLSKEMI